jgi:hypothetical protein
MKTLRAMALGFTLPLTLGGGQIAVAETPFVSFDVQTELGFPPDPVVTMTLFAQAMFEPATEIDPATELVTVEFYPPDPVVPPDPVYPVPTVWQLRFSPGCFVQKPGGQIRVEDFSNCGTSLLRFYDDGTSEDLSTRIYSLDADFKPPSGTNTQWRFRIDLAARPELKPVPPDPIYPPDPIKGHTQLTIGDDVGTADYTLVRWEGTQ